MNSTEVFKNSSSDLDISSNVESDSDTEIISSFSSLQIELKDEESEALTNEISKDKKEEILKRIREKWWDLTNEELIDFMVYPFGSAELCRLAHKMSDEKLQIICPYMSEKNITTFIPTIDLQKQGVAIQAFSAHQINSCVRSISKEDRRLLLDNIKLIISSENNIENEEIQSLITFIDPLAMGMQILNL